MKRILSIGVALGFMGVVSLASAQSCTSAPFDALDVSGTDVATLQCFQSGGKWSVTITATDDDDEDGFITVTLRANDTVQIDNATLTNTAGSMVELRVRLLGAVANPEYLQSVDEIEVGGTSNGTVTLVDLQTDDDVGSISVDALDAATIGGNLTGAVTVSNGDLGTLNVMGNIAGTAAISVPSGSIDFINVPTAGADIGSGGNPADISCGVGLRDIYVADDVYCNITVGSGAGPVGRIEVDGSVGPQGTWNFDQFDDISASTSGLYVAGNHWSPTTIEGDLDEPIQIDGSLLGALLIEGGATASITIGQSNGLESGTVGSLTIGASLTTTPVTSDITIGSNSGGSSFGITSNGLLKITAPYAGDLAIERGNVAGTAANRGLRFESDLTGSATLVGTTGGNLVGQISVNGMLASTALIDIAGDMNSGSQLQVMDDFEGRVRVRGDMSGYLLCDVPVESTGVIEIGDTLSTTSGNNGLIRIKGASPLAGQIVINSNNNGGAWSGSVTLGPDGGSTTLSPSYYPTLSSTFGGGAVGLAPFRLHGLDCAPVDGGSVSTSDDSVTLRFYGPVKWTSGLPFSVEVCTGRCSEDVDVSNEFAATGNGTREITLTRTAGNFPADTVWHVRPLTLGASALKCADLLTGSDVLVTTFTYDFSTP